MLNVILYVALNLTLATFSWLWPIFLKDPAHRPLLQLLLYSDESIIYSICSSVVMLTVHFKGSLQMKASLPVSTPFFSSLLSFLSVFERNIWALFDANDEVFPLKAECKHHNMDSEGSRRLLGFLHCGGEKRTTAKRLIFVISVISKKPGVKLFLAPQFKPLLFIFWPWN